MSYRDEVRTALQVNLTEFGESIAVLKYAAGAVSDPYKQRKPSFAAPVNVRGIFHRGMLEEIRGMIGDAGEAEGSITFIKTMLVDEGLDADDPITTKDRVTVRGVDRKIVWVHETGNLYDDEEVVVVGWMGITGSKTG